MKKECIFTFKYCRIDDKKMPKGENEGKGYGGRERLRKREERETKRGRDEALN